MPQFPAIAQGAGHLFFDSPLGESAKIALLREGIDRGMTFIDTAESYGKGLSEELVGKAVAGRREKVVIASKVSPENLSYERVLCSAEQSLRRLQVETLDLYQIHWPNPAVPLEETLRAFSKLLNDGKIKAIGLCNFSKKSLQEAEKALGSACISSFQTEYNLFERLIETDGTLDYCRSRGIRIIAYSPINPQKFAFIPKEKITFLEKTASAYGKTKEQLILSWIIKNVSLIPLVRTTRQDHLIENSQAPSIELKPEDIRKISEAFPIHYDLVPTKHIRVASSENYNHSVYKTLEEAIDNKLGFAPSPKDLAGEILGGEFLKPVQLLRSKRDDGKEFELIVGAMRYWAWVIAHGWEKPIPAYVYSK